MVRSVLRKNEKQGFASLRDTFKHTGMNMYALIGDTFKHTCMNIHALNGDVFKPTGMNIYTFTISAPNLILSVVTGFGSNILTKKITEIIK